MIKWTVCTHLVRPKITTRSIQRNHKCHARPSRGQSRIGHLLVVLYAVCCNFWIHLLCADCSFNYFCPIVNLMGESTIFLSCMEVSYCIVLYCIVLQIWRYNNCFYTWWAIWPLPHSVYTGVNKRPDSPFQIPWNITSTQESIGCVNRAMCTRQHWFWKHKVIKNAW